jgi:hypothetical protein
MVVTSRDEVPSEVSPKSATFQSLLDKENRTTISEKQGGKLTVLRAEITMYFATCMYENQSIYNLQRYVDNMEE